MNKIYYFIIFFVLFFLTFKRKNKNFKKKNENFANENEDCIMRREILDLINPNVIGTPEETIEFETLKESGYFDDNEIDKIKKSVIKNGPDSIKNYYKCN